MPTSSCAFRVTDADGTHKLPITAALRRAIGREDERLS